MIAMLNFGLNSQVPEVQFDSAAATPNVWTTPEDGLLSPESWPKAVKALYERAQPVICRTLKHMSHSPVDSARMCGYMMTVDIYDMMCKVADYVGINIHTYAEVDDDSHVSSQDKGKDRMENVQNIFEVN